MTSRAAYRSKYGRSWALVVGINDYAYTSRLDYARNDAEAVANLLRTKFKFSKTNMTLLLDGDATAAAIRAAFLKYSDASKVEDDDRLIVFYAGHGHTVTGKRGEVGFLVPVDGKLGNLETLIRWDELTRNADLIPAKHVFFMMDACYGGLALQRQPPFGSMRFLGDMLQRYARQVLTAGKADEAVSDGNGVRPGHSMFTAHLLNALDGAAATKDGVTTASGVMAYVYDHVAKDQYSRQTPHFGFVDGDGDLIFDTSLLDKVRTNGAHGSTDQQSDARGDSDVLINTSPEISGVRPVPASVSEIVKELLSDPSKRIKLDDYISQLVRRFLDLADLRHFPLQGRGVQKEEILERVARYEEITRDLQQVVIQLAKWGDEPQLQLLGKVITRLAEADKGSSGLIVWLRLTWYPIVLLLYSAGISALAAHRFSALRIALTTLTQPEPDRGKGAKAIVVPAMQNLVELRDAFKLLPGLEQKYVPISEYLFKALQPILEDELLLGRSYEATFDAFEIFVALTYADVTESGWGPPGRFAWKHGRGYGDNPYEELTSAAQEAGQHWEPLAAGLFQGSFDRFKSVADHYRGLIAKLNWF